MRILGLDPGTEVSGVIEYNASIHAVANPVAEMPNDEVFAQIDELVAGDVVACEMIASYGMPVGAEVFETCVWIGEFRRAAHLRGVLFERRTRMQVKMHLCHSQHAGDPNIKAALVDRFPGGKGTVASKGPLYGVSKHAWSALAVAITYAETR